MVACCSKSDVHFAIDNAGNAFGILQEEKVGEVLG